MYACASEGMENMELCVSPIVLYVAYHLFMLGFIMYVSYSTLECFVLCIHIIIYIYTRVHVNVALHAPH